MKILTLLMCLMWGAGWARAAFTMADIRLWAGAPTGPGVQSAALVVDWNDGQAPLAWGYRWIGSNQTGRDMLRAIAAADPRFTLQGLQTGFVSNFAFDVDLNGQPERFRPGWDGVSKFWTYSVNNAVFTDPNDFSKNSHIVPPNTKVVPNGDPFALSSAGRWISSSTGVLERPLVDGSWDGFRYDDGSGAIDEPVAASPIPEPSSALFLVMSLACLATRRRRARAAMSERE